MSVHEYTATPSHAVHLTHHNCQFKNTLPFLALDRTSEGHTRFLGVAPPNSDIAPAATQFKFVTECFFITQRALHIGLIPALNTFSQVTSDLGRQLQSESSSEGEDRKASILKKLYVVSIVFREFFLL